MRWLYTPFEVPHRLRAIVRARELSVIVLALVVGVLAGLVVAAMGEAVGLLHVMFFGLDPGERLSGRGTLNPIYAFLTPCLGGLAFGLVTAYVTRRRGTEVDPIEANALHGGRMSLRGSLIVAAQTVWSSGVGASVGLEAGYTQLASGIASKIGQAFRLRRSDMRVLVGCGAAAAIAGAFGAPLGGAFYGFELIIGSYSIASLAPVGMAALVGYLTAQAFAPDRLGIETGAVSSLAVHDVVIAGGVGLLAAMFGIALMRGVAACERLFSRLGVRPALRPMIGGMVVGLLAMVSPQVMSSGHGALHLTGIFKLPLATIAMILALKALASIVSLGTGFRGGLFFASLLLGALGGQLFAVGLNAVYPALHRRSRRLCHHRHGRAVGLGDRRAAHHDVHRAGDDRRPVADDRGADRGDRLDAGDARILRLFVHHLALPSTRRDHPQRCRRRLDQGPERRADDALGRAHDAGGDTDLGLSRGLSARFDQSGDRGGRGRPLRRHGDRGGSARRRNCRRAASVREILHHADHVLLPQMTAQEAITAFDRYEAEALAVVEFDRTPAGDRPAQRGARLAALFRRLGAAAARIAGRDVRRARLGGVLRPAGEPFGRRRDGHRPAEEIPLREAAAGGAQEIALAGGFHAFRHYVDAEFVREPDGGAHDRRVVGTGAVHR